MQTLCKVEDTMPVHDLYSDHKRVADGDLLYVYEYDELPDALRIQIDYISRDAIGRVHNFSGHEYGEVIHFCIH